MSGDATITANRASYGGVYLKKPADTDPEYTGGTFTMNGGTISGNKVSSYNFGFPSLGNGDGGEKDGFRCGFCDKYEKWRDLPYMGLIVRLAHYFVHLGQWISYIT